MRTEVYLFEQVALSLCTIHLYRVVRSRDHGDLSRQNPFDRASLSNEKLKILRRNLMRLTKSLMKLEELNQNTINNNAKGSQLMMLRKNMIQFRMI